ncbi:histidine phosphatase family protein [Rhizobium sp. BK196]|uniref:histidine phosphatase family protein n=1 Tax=Rhizobium sp. BK196 TaxID=2587073 RepID=UPI00160EBDA8
MTTCLTWINNGATAANRTASFPMDEPLEEQAMSKATLPSPGQADRVFVSPALRTRQTAEMLGFDAVLAPALRDCDYGRWSGKPLMSLRSEEPDNFALWISDPEAAPHEGESLQQLCKRVAGWMNEEMPLGGHVVAVTHAAVIRAAILDVLKAPAASFWTIDVQPLGMVRMTHDNRRWSLRF